MNTARATAIAGLSAMDALLNGGSIAIYSGTQPATPQTALSGNTELVRHTFNTPAFGTPAWNSGTGKVEAAASFVSTSANPSNSGTAAFARAYASDTTTVVNDYTVGTSTQDLVIGSTSINVGVPVTVNSLTHKLGAT